ncbi:MAG: glycosyltransferase family 1 protein [Rhodocyclaceae bacterium]|nr:glycosyltransferase family 1 protein [Rhodocyclaceae bacterium]
MKPLHIALVTETYPPEINGVAMTVGRLVAGMRARGHRVEVVRPRQYREARGTGLDLALPSLPLPGYAGLRFGLPARGALIARWKGDRPDLVHVVTEGPLGWSAVSAASRLGIPSTSAFHTNFDSYSTHYGAGWLRPALSSYLRSFHRRTRATLVPTEALAATLAGEGVPGVKVVGRGVDTDLFDPARRSNELRREWLGHASADKGKLACLYVGRLAPEKNLAVVEAAFAAIRAHRPDARMIWVGDGPARARLADAHPDHLFAGPRIGVDLATHYASADLFLFPSLTETYGNVVPEAMASGLPVVAYRSAAAAELILDGENGRSVPPGDVGAFLNAATALANAPDPAPLARRARITALERGWDAVVDRFESVLNEVSGHDGH